MGGGGAGQSREEGEVGRGHDSARAAPFATPVGWATVDRAGIVGAEIRPWVHKTIAEFLGDRRRR